MTASERIREARKNGAQLTQTHTADVYGGSIALADVTPDPANANMVFGLVVRDSRGELNTGSRIWIAAAQVMDNLDRNKAIIDHALANARPEARVGA